MSDVDSNLAMYERFLESMAPAFPAVPADDWHLRLIWIPSFRPERIHDIRSTGVGPTITLTRCLQSAWEAWSLAGSNRGILQSVPVETATERLPTDEPVLKLVADGVPLKLTDPGRLGCDGESWVCRFQTRHFTIATRVWSPEGGDWLRLVEAMQHAAGRVPRRHLEQL